VLVITVAWRGDTRAVLRPCIAVHVVTIIVTIIHVRIAMVKIRVPPGMDGDKSGGGDGGRM
jgi:hypothetical protein